jgi:hypothetical protein
MALCKCGESFSEKRAALGYKTCLECGDNNAKSAIEEKRNCVVIPYNKGPYMLLVSVSELNCLGKEKK